jgi:hypothetical protein
VVTVTRAANARSVMHVTGPVTVPPINGINDINDINDHTHKLQTSQAK